MPQTFDVAVIIGSLRQASLCRKVAKAMIALAPDALNCRIVEIGDLAMYNEDLEAESPAPWTRFRDEIRNAHAIVFVTPEYNRTVPGCIKNAIDVGSRPKGQNSWDGKPTAVISVTPSKLGAFGANHVLRQSFVFLNMPAMQQPEAYLSLVGDMFDEHDQLKFEANRDFFTYYMFAFARFVAMHNADVSTPNFADWIKQRAGS